jgi:hypothetical protein
MAEVSIRKSPKWKRGTVENGSSNILADCCWSLIRETPTGECKMEKKTKWVFNGFFCSYDTVHRDTSLFDIVYCN